MKILMVNKYLYRKGGAETYVMELGEQLRELGHEVQFFGMRHDHMDAFNDLGLYTRELDFREGSYIGKLSYLFRIVFSWEAYKKMKRLLEYFEPDVVHLNNFNYQLTPSVIMAADRWRVKNRRDCRIIYTAHDYNLVCPNHMLRCPSTGKNCSSCLGGGFYHCAAGKCIHGSRIKSIMGSMEGYFWYHMKTYRKIDQVICCSDFMRSVMEKSPWLKGRTVTLHNFVNMKGQDAGGYIEAGKECSDSTKGPEGRYVLYFGRYAEEKGIRTLLRAAERLPEVSFVFAGSGPLKELISDVPNARDLGFLKGEELDRLISGAYFCVCPSEWYENDPFSIIEAQIRGVPVLGADTGGIPERIRAGVNGELFRSGDEEELCQKIKELWEDENRIRGFKAELLKKEGFDDIESYCNKLIKCYEGEAL